MTSFVLSLSLSLSLCLFLSHYLSIDISAYIYFELFVCLDILIPVAVTSATNITINKISVHAISAFQKCQRRMPVIISFIIYKIAHNALRLN